MAIHKTSDNTKRVEYAETRVASTGRKYLRVRLDGLYLSCFDDPLPEVKAGDVVSYKALDTVTSVVRGLTVIGSAERTAGGVDDNLVELAPYLSYAKDIEAADSLGEVDAIGVAIRLMDAFGTSRFGCMLASYAKDLVLSGMDVSDAIAWVQEAVMRVSEHRGNLQGSGE